MKCTCGCNEEAQYLVTGHDFDPYKKGNKGKPFIDQPCCEHSMLYLVEGGDELGLPATVRRIINQ